MWGFSLSYRNLPFPLFYFVGNGLEPSAFLGLSPCVRLAGSLGHLFHQSLQHLVGRLLRACQLVSVDAHNLLTLGNYGCKGTTNSQILQGLGGKRCDSVTGVTGGHGVRALEGTTLEKAQIYLAFCSLNRTLSFARRYFRSKRQKKIFFLLPFAHLIVPL